MLFYKTVAAVVMLSFIGVIGHGIIGYILSAIF